MPGEPPMQHQRAGHEAAAEHAVELADAGGHARHRAAPPPRPAAPGAAPCPTAAGRPAGAAARVLLDEACSTRRSRGSARATWGSRGRRPSRRRGCWSGPCSEAKRAGGRLRPRCKRVIGAHPAEPCSARLIPSVRRRRLHRLGGAARATRRRRRVRGARHRDQRARRRPLRAHRGRRRAGRRRRAARDLRLARAPGAAAVARDPALHRHHPGDGGRRAAAGRGAAGGGRAARGPRAGGAQRALRQPRAAPGVRARRPRLARARPRSARSRWPAASPRWRASAGSRSLADALGIEVRRGAPRAARRAHLRARVLRAVPAPVRERGDGRRGARPAALAPPGAQDGAGRARSRRRSGPTSPRSPTTRASTCSATTAAGRSTWASRCRCARAPAPTSARPPAGPSAPRSWTTGPPTPSSARSCSRTG